MGLQKTYSSAYDIRVTKLEALKLERLHKRKEYCDKCESLAACQYNGSGRGFRQMASTYKVNGVKVLYFGVIQCSYLLQWQQNQRYERLLLQSKIPSAYSNLTFEDYEVHKGNMEALAAGLKLRSIYIYSHARRIGKTMLACLIGNELIRRGESVLFTTAPELMINLRYNSERYDETLRAVRTATTLIIDDIGSERDTEYNGEQLFMIFDYRVREGLRTVVTSNLEIRELSRRYGINGERIADRIKQESEIVSINFGV